MSLAAAPVTATNPAPAVYAGRQAVQSQGSRRWRVPGQILRWTLLILVSLAFLYPLAWLLSASFKPRGQVFDNRLIPETFQPQNYVDVWEKLPLLAWVGNSILIAVLSAGLMTLSSSLVAFGFAYFRFPLKRLLFGLVLASMMLPGAVTLVPNYLIWKWLGWLGTSVPLWGAALFGSGFYIFLMRQFYLSLPRDLPSSIIVFIFEFQASWQNFQGPLIYLNFGSPEQYTVPLGISYAMTQFSPTAGGQGDYQYVMVASLVVTLPMMIIFAFGQRYFIEGVATAGLKG